MKTDWLLSQHARFIWQKTEKGWRLRFIGRDGQWKPARHESVWPDAPSWQDEAHYKPLSEREVFTLVL